MYGNFTIIDTDIDRCAISGWLSSPWWAVDLQNVQSIISVEVTNNVRFRELRYYLNYIYNQYHRRRKLSVGGRVCYD